jgi:alpha-L-fucosidase
MKYFFLIVATALSQSLPAQALLTYGALPTSSQLRWHSMEYYMFIHFGPNTFTNKEWGHGDEDPKVFNPTQLDCRQWARTAKQAGMKGIIVTAKHHDGFCLWPSKFSTHTVRESSWKEGRGDVLMELSKACRKEGLKFGVYLSPWDRNHPDYGTDTYNQTFVNMLQEVLGNYGVVFEQWFDGANGEGPNGKKQVYDWKLFNGTVHKLQPQAIIFSDGGPGCRWVGNENGFAGETNWCTLNVEKVYPGYPNNKELTLGHEDGNTWIPAECDVSIRPGWFYSPETDGKVKSITQLMEIYYASIGRGGNLLLNVPVDRRGLIPKEDSARLMEFRSVVDHAFEKNLAGLSEISGASRNGYAVKNLIDGNTSTSWAPDGVGETGEVVLTFKSPVRFNRVILQEDIAAGQRVKSFYIDVQDNNGWVTLDHQTTIGHKRILRMKETATAKIRIRIRDSKAIPVLTEIGIYFAKD